jgi:hypothetical protein
MSASKVQRIDAAHDQASEAIDFYLQYALQLQYAVSRFAKLVFDFSNEQLANESTLDNVLDCLLNALLERFQTTPHDDAA